MGTGVNYLATCSQTAASSQIFALNVNNSRGCDMKERDFGFQPLQPADLEPWDGTFEVLPKYAEITVACKV